MKMVKSKFSKLKAALVSGILAVSAIATPFPTAAPSLEVDAAASDNYARLLQYSLYFYDANMCGKEVDSKSAITWRGNCHTDDEIQGGYHDAGDHAMFGLPQGFTASVLGWSYYEFKDAYQKTGQADHLELILDHFCDFFKNSTKLSGNSVSNFLYQKGDGNEDHGYWGAPELQPAGRKMFWTSNSASDIAADYAAALALNYINFGDSEDLKYAEALYNFSTQHNKCESNGPTGFYLANGCSPVDEQANAAGWLYLATKNEKYKNDCASKQTQYLGWCDGWDNRGLGAACVYAHITGDWGKVNSFLSGYTNNSSYLCMDNWGSARLNCSMQMSALVATKNSSANHANWAKGQMNYILGDNPFNTCFVTGFASNSAKNTHHRAASGYQGYSDGMSEHTTTYHPTNGKTLIGALTGGPNKAGQYSDVLNDYQCNEVAIDYNAGLVGAAAGLYSIFGGSGTVDTSITGVDKIYSAGTPPTTTEPPKQTTAPIQQTTKPIVVTTTKAPSVSGSNGSYTLKLNQDIVYKNLPENDKMIGWEWSEFDIPAGEKPSKVEIKISASGNIGKWEGAFGSSTSKSPDYWTQTDDMSKTISSNSGTITWDIDSADASIIQLQYGGELKWGIWWIDCNSFTIDEITVYTSGSSASTTAPKATTTKKITTTTPKNSSSPSESGVYELKLNQDIVYKNLPEDDKMIGWEWSEFGIPAGETPKKVEINISASGNIGKWEGAFGSSTSKAPDYWLQTDDMSKTISSNSGTITWNIDSSDASLIQLKYGGELKWGIWWIDCNSFTIDSIKVYTSGSTSSITTTTTKKVTTTQKVTTTKKVTTTTKPTTTAKPVPSVTKAGDANGNGSVDIADAVLIKCYILNPSKYSISSQGRANADVQGNGNGINFQDALAIQKFILGDIKSLPVN